jgi:hypothetical protein
VSVIDAPISLPTPDWVRGAVRIGLLPVIVLVAVIVATQFEYSCERKSPWSLGFSDGFGPVHYYIKILGAGFQIEIELPITIGKRLCVARQ